MNRNTFTDKLFLYTLVFLLMSSLIVPVMTAAAAEETVEGSAFPKTFEELDAVNSFTINETTISLPTTFDEMRTVGLSLDGYITSDTIRANGIAGMEVYNSDGASLKIDVFGDKAKDVPRDDAKIIGIDIDQAQLDKLGVNFAGPGGIKLGDSIYDVQKLFGGTVKENSITYRLTYLMSEKGYIEKDQVLSPFFEELLFVADENGNITRMKIKYCRE